MKQEFLPRIIRGEIEFAIGYSEPGAGSDAANMKLRAERVDGGWCLNGQKVWTTSAHFADWYWVGARTDPDAPKHRGISLLLIPMDHPGLTIHPTWTIGDERTNEVFFENVFVPDEYVVGEVNNGWAYICEALDLERFAMMPVGPLERKVEALCAWVRGATRDRRPLREDRAVRARIAHIVTDLEVSRMLQRRVIAQAVKGGMPTVASSQYKLFMNETGQRVANAAVDMLGPAGQLRVGTSEAPLGGRFERSYRYTVVDTIGGGTSEIQKNIIARRGLGLPPSY
jgi:alkylation response protein AidB-like acyl-CoA dehydrogenase